MKPLMYFFFVTSSLLGPNVLKHPHSVLLLYELKSDLVDVRFLSNLHGNKTSHN
jgi:hypothetical protein